VYICVWRYSVNFLEHYNIHYITFIILVRETWNDYRFWGEDFVQKKITNSSLIKNELISDSQDKLS
jgi:hypothetical protein